MAGTRHRERDQALSRLASAVRRGIIIKPDSCQLCGKPGGKQRGTVAWFANGYAEWRNPVWCCYSCHAIKIGRKRPTGPPKGDQVHWNRTNHSPPYDQMKALLDRGMSWRQIARHCGLSSHTSLQQTFKRRAQRRGEWPYVRVPSLAQQRVLNGSQPKSNTISTTGLREDYIALMRRTKLRSNEVVERAGAGVPLTWMQRFLRGDCPRTPFSRYNAMSRTLRALEEEYADYEARLAGARDRLWARRAVSTGRGIGDVAHEAHVGWQNVSLLMKGRVIHPAPLSRIEVLIEKWEAEDGVLA